MQVAENSVSVISVLVDLPQALLAFLAEGFHLGVRYGESGEPCMDFDLAGRAFDGRPQKRVIQFADSEVEPGWPRTNSTRPE